MADVFDSIIMDCSAELKKFRGVVCELDMPQISVEAFLEQVFPTFMTLANREQELAVVAAYMSVGEGLFEGLVENSEEELFNETQERIVKAVITFGNDMKNKLDQYHAYRSGKFPYTFKEYVNDRTVVLSKYHSGDSGPHHLGHMGVSK